MDALIHRLPGENTKWLHVKPSAEGDGWNIGLSNDVPPFGTMVDTSSHTLIPKTIDDQIVNQSAVSDDSVLALEEERKFLRQMVKYLATTMDPNSP